MRLLYLKYPKSQTLSDQLTWSHYVGQMNAYLNYFKSEVSADNDSPPIGIVLGAKKDNILVEYALGSISNKLFVSRYKLYLPNKKELTQRLRYSLESKNNK